MVIIGCYWHSSGLNSSLTIECYDDVTCTRLYPVVQNSSITVSGFSSVTHPTQADEQLIGNGLGGLITALQQAGHNIGAIHEKTWSRAPQARNWPRARGQQAATALTQMAKTEINRVGQAHGVQVVNKEDVPQNLHRGNFLAASRALVNTYLGTMNRDQRLAVCLAMDLANNKAQLQTLSNKIIKQWLIRATRPSKRTNIKPLRDQIIQAL